MSDKDFLPGERLNAMHVLRSPNGNYTLRIQRNGEVVIRQDQDFYLQYGTDGDFAIYNAKNERLSSLAVASPAGRVDLRNDGLLYLRDSSNAVKWTNKCTVQPSLKSDGVHEMPVDTCLVSSDESALLVLQRDGNLVTCIGYEPKYDFNPPENT
ncbi:hypothetical protein BGX34_010685 [Mortierella sp. NVP85]|nr:hypothetical protein BGX34_010685 [Mortierella sp. NVP85]